MMIAAANLYACGQTKHFIIAFDQSIEMYRSAVYNNPRILGTLDNLLCHNGYDKEKDYISIVGYSMQLGRPSADNFVRPYNDSEGNDILWNRDYKGSLNRFFPSWPSGEPALNHAGAPFASLQSACKPYIAMAAKAPEGSGLTADRTFVYIVTDGIVNGVDDNYLNEWNNVRLCAGADTRALDAMSKPFFNTIRDFNEDFKYLQTGFMVDAGHKWPKYALSSDGRYSVVPYELVWADRPSIHAVTDMPSTLPLKRVRGGYGLDMEVRSLDPKYSITSLNIFNREGKQVYSYSAGRNKPQNIRIPSKSIREGDTLTIDMALLLKDGFYNGMTISPLNSRYAEGMTLKEVVKLPEETKVLGIFPLWDIFWWWFPNDAFKAVMVWDVAIVVIILLLVAWCLYRMFVNINTYRPSDSNLKITKVTKAQR